MAENKLPCNNTNIKIMLSRLRVYKVQTALSQRVRQRRRKKHLQVGTSFFVAYSAVFVWDEIMRRLQKSLKSKSECPTKKRYEKGEQLMCMHCARW